MSAAPGFWAPDLGAGIWDRHDISLTSRAWIKELRYHRSGRTKPSGGGINLQIAARDPVEAYATILDWHEMRGIALTIFYALLKTRRNG